MPYTSFISSQELAKNDQRPDWVILDCRFNLSDPASAERAYLEAHLPGALYVHLERDLCGLPNGSNGRHPLPSLPQMINLFSRLGIDSEVQVVAYDDNGGGFAGRLWWMLRYLGHQSVALLDGGMQSWVGGDHRLQPGIETRKRRDFTGTPNSAMLVKAEEILDGVPLLVDGRAADRYQGLVEPIDAVAGHIPGAVNRFWQDNLDEELKIRSAGSLRDEFAALLQGRSAAESVFYCGSGVTACLNLVAMEHAGYPLPRLYPGSWSEWISDPRHPIARGEPG